MGKGYIELNVRHKHMPLNAWEISPQIVILPQTWEIQFYPVIIEPPLNLSVVREQL